MFMGNRFAKLIERIEHQAQVCETVAKDKTEESLTGESSEKEMNEAEAREWALKAGVWREAVALVRSFSNPDEAIKPVVPNPLETPANLSPQSSATMLRKDY
jgi:hypothetical protein